MRDITKQAFFGLLCAVIFGSGCSEGYMVPIWEMEFQPPEELQDVALWDTCPAMTPQAAPTEGEHIWVQATKEAKYCNQSIRRSGELTDTFANKSQLRIVPGDFFLPMQLGTQPFTLPVCSLFEDHDDSPRPVGEGLFELYDEQIFNATRLDGTIRQPMMANGTMWTFEMHFTGFEDALARGFQLDGSHWLRASDPEVIFMLCEGVACDGSGEQIQYDSCNFESAPQEVHVLGFGDDYAALTIANYASAWNIEGGFVSAEGELDGVSFTQTSFWKLAMKYSSQWGDSRDFQVTFDHPIGLYCGLKVFQAWPYVGYDYGTRVEKVTCDGATVEVELDYATWDDIEDIDQEGE